MVVLDKYSIDYVAYRVAGEGDTPSVVSHNIIDAFLAGMTCSFHGIACKRTERRYAVASAKEDRVSRVADMVSSGISVPT